MNFAETFDGISECVFSFDVESRGVNNFDVRAKAGVPNRAYIEIVNVEVTDGRLGIKFTPKVENPEIHGMEILPAS